jgi:HAD superfamily hydrolase (TIGR01450 family)
MGGDDNAEAVALSPALSPYAHVLLDLDGTLWVGEEACPGAPEAVAALREAGLGVRFLSNDVRSAPEDFVRKLWRLGFQAAVAEVVSVGAAVEAALAERDGGSAFVIGSQALVDHVAAAGLRIVNRTPFATRADVVVVGGHDGLVYDELRVATQAVLRGAELVGAARDATFPMPDGPWPATGAVLAAVEAATRRTADLVVGKPEPPMYAAARASLGPGRVLAVGDRLEVDVAGALAAGLDAALIGEPQADAPSPAGPRPTFVAPSLAALVLGDEAPH